MPTKNTPTSTKFDPDKTKTILDFLNWFGEQGYMLGEWKEPIGWERVYKTPAELLQEYEEIELSPASSIG